MAKYEKTVTNFFEPSIDNNVYTNALKKYTENAEKEAEKAKQIEHYMNIIKDWVLGDNFKSGDPIYDFFKEAFHDIITAEGFSRASSYFKTILTQARKQGFTAKEKGNQFEYMINRLLNLDNNLGKKEKIIKNYKETAGRGQISIQNVINDSQNLREIILNDQRKDLKQQLLEKMPKEMSIFTKTGYVRPITQKVDVEASGSDSYIFATELPSEAKDVLINLNTLTKGCSFTIKNYTGFKKGINVGLGNSKSLTVYLGSFSYIYGNIKPSIVIRLAYQMYFGYDKNNELPEGIAEIARNLRFFYELTGAGQAKASISKNGEVGFGDMKMADFLIINDKNPKKKITVKSCKEILSHLFNGEDPSGKKFRKFKKWDTFAITIMYD